MSLTYRFYEVSSVNIFGGPTKDVVKVEASQEYKDLIVRLSSAPKPQSSSITSFKRWLNKKLGRPSTLGVKILSSLIVRLKDATETELGISLDKIVIAQPRFYALTADDMRDAIEYAGLQSWLHVPHEDAAPNQLSENRAVLAAHGVNLCQEYGSWSICLEHMSEVAEQVTVYFVSLSKSALYTSLDTYLKPFQYIQEYEPHFFDSKFGLDSMAEYPSNESYWATVQDKLLPPRDGNAGRPISHVLIGGEAAMIPEFHDALRNALANATILGAHDGAIVNTTLFAAARGAALLARWRQEAPMNCWEVIECTERRRQEREDKLGNIHQEKLKLK